MNRPNVLIITCHDLGDFVGCYGTPVATPNVDSIAADGVIFAQHFSTGSVCSPARGSIVTGCYPHTHGLMGLVHRGWELDVERCPPLPTLLAGAGYRTHLFGFQHEHWDPSRLGYQQVHGGRTCELVAAETAQWLRSDARAGDEPFLAAVGWSETHRLGLPSHFNRDVYEPADPADVEVPPYLPDVPEMREDLAGLYGAVKHMDQAVGEILAALDEAGLRDNTLVIFAADHGASFIHAKATLYDGGTKVPWLMRWPGGLDAPMRCEKLTSHVDIAPTLLDLLGVAIPAHVQGQSLADRLRAGRPDDDGREYVFAEKNVTNYYDPTRMVRSDSMKYIRKGLRTCVFDFQIPEIEQCSCDFRRHKGVREFYSARRCTEELYDLEADPGELSNLIDDPARADALAELRAALDAHLEATDDPFRHLRNDLLMPADVYPEVMRKWG